MFCFLFVSVSLSCLISIISLPLCVCVCVCVFLSFSLSPPTHLPPFLSVFLLLSTSVFVCKRECVFFCTIFVSRWMSVWMLVCVHLYVYVSVSSDSLKQENDVVSEREAFHGLRQSQPICPILKYIGSYPSFSFIFPLKLYQYFTCNVVKLVNNEIFTVTNSICLWEFWREFSLLIPIK